MDDNQLDWLADYLKSDDVEQEHALLINWIDKLLYQAGVEERQADARIVCLRCASGDECRFIPREVETDWLVPHWYHAYMDRSGRTSYIACSAAPIWERGRAESERA